MSFYIRPIESMTRRRDNHSTLGAILSYVGPSDLVKCSVEFVADKDLFTTDGMLYQKTGDKWGHVEALNGVEQVPGSWVSITHKGAQISNFVAAPPVEESPTLVHTIETFSDGSLVIDGTPYP